MPCFVLVAKITFVLADFTTKIAVTLVGYLADLALCTFPAAAAVAIGFVIIAPAAMVATTGFPVDYPGITI